ncbi:DUF551 domain-containing protein [Escherichia coli]|nr:DUF551 domain-containing protein [Escherichia coli]
MRFARLASKSASRGIRDMAELTKEWLKQTIAEYEANRDELPFGLDTNSAIELQAFKLALASLEAEPVAYIFKHPAGKLFWALTDESNKDQSDVIPVYAAHPVPVVPAALPENDDEDGHDIDYLEPSEVYSLGRTAGWNACRAAMLHGAEPVSQTYKLPPLSSNEVNDAAWKLRNMLTEHGPLNGRQFNNLKGCFYEALKVAMRNYPVTPDGWISCSERMPDTKTAVLVAKEFDRKGDWRMKWATYIPGHPDANDGWIIPGASWKPSHWMPLPEPPQEVNRG